jgi:hypothetical protein
VARPEDELLDERDGDRLGAAWAREPLDGAERASAGGEEDRDRLGGDGSTRAGGGDDGRAFWLGSTRAGGGDDGR